MRFGGGSGKGGARKEDGMILQGSSVVGLEGGTFGVSVSSLISMLKSILYELKGAIEVMFTSLEFLTSLAAAISTESEP